MWKIWTKIWSFSEFNLAIQQWKIPWYSVIDKFWKNPLITTGTDPEVVWWYGGMYTYTADAGTTYYFSSSDSGDTQNIRISVLTVDSNGNFNDEIFEQKLVWQTKTALIPTSWDPIVRIYRMQNVDSVDLAGTVYVYEDDTVVGWVPQTPSLVRAIIDNWDNQTLMAVYTIPTGKVWFLYKWEVWLEFTWSVWSWTQFATVNYRSRRPWEVFRIQKELSLINLWSSNYVDVRTFPDIIPAKTDIEIVVKEVSSDMWVWATFDILLVDENLFTNAYLTAIWQEKRVS